MEVTTVYDDRLVVETPEAVAFDLELAGLGSRSIAFLIDQLILAAIVLVEALLLLAVVAGLESANVQLATGWLIGLGLTLLFITIYGYYVLFEVRRNGKTPGKRIVGISVVHESGGRVTFGASAIRNLLRFVDALPSGYLVGILAVLVSKRRQRVGDMAAGTVVIYAPKERPLQLGEVLLSETTAIAYDFLSRRNTLSPPSRDVIAREVMLSLGEEPSPYWDEPTVAGRIADIIGVREVFQPAIQAPPAMPAGPLPDASLDSSSQAPPADASFASSGS